MIPVDLNGRAEEDHGNRKTGKKYLDILEGLLLKTVKIPKDILSWIFTKECSWVKEYIFFSANPLHQQLLNYLLYVLTKINILPGYKFNLVLLE